MKINSRQEISHDVDRAYLLWDYGSLGPLVKTGAPMEKVYSN